MNDAITDNIEETLVTTIEGNKPSNDDNDITPSLADIKVVPCVVKMKLSSFIEDPRIRTAIAKVAKDMNRVVAEAYCFANFHISRLINEGHPLPTISHKFYYQCLLCVTTNNARSNTIDAEFVTSRNAFDALRVPGSQKVDISEYNQVVASYRIVMCTMATNHLWENIESRLKRYLKWRYPHLKGCWAGIVKATIHPKDDLNKMFDKVDSNKASEARAVCQEFRESIRLPGAGHFSTTAHLLIPLYAHILRETEAAKAEQNRCLQLGLPLTRKKTKFKTFTILPIKSGFTASHVPISSMMFLSILKKSKLEKFKGDGRNEDAKVYWKKHANLNGVETCNRTFDGSVVTDGYAVSILMARKTSACCPCTLEKREEHLAKAKGMMGEREDDNPVLKVSIDPGGDDVVTAYRSDGTIWHFSSKQYYEETKVFASNKKTYIWNQETIELVRSIATPETIDHSNMILHVKSYLKALPELLAHRWNRGYRALRFLRYQAKQKVIQKICDGIVVDNTRNCIVGFGDWKGFGSSPISRRCCGPLQEIKLELIRRENVAFISIDEYKTSITCHCCHQPLVNMKAMITNIKRNADGEKTRRTYHGRVHKVLHCKNSMHNVAEGERCKTTWNRDVNAAKNIMTLLMHELYSWARPSVFLRSDKKSTRRGRRTS